MGRSPRAAEIICLLASFCGGGMWIYSFLLERATDGSKKRWNQTSCIHQLNEQTTSLQISQHSIKKTISVYKSWGWEMDRIPAEHIKVSCSNTGVTDSIFCLCLKTRCNVSIHSLLKRWLTWKLVENCLFNLNYCRMLFIMFFFAFSKVNL